MFIKSTPHNTAQDNALPSLVLCLPPLFLHWATITICNKFTAPPQGFKQFSENDCLHPTPSHSYTHMCKEGK